METGIDHSARQRTGINCFSFNRKMHCGIVRRRSTVHFYPLPVRRLRPLRWEMNCVRYVYVSNESMDPDLCLHEILVMSKSSDHYSSTTSSTSIGQDFAQIPQAIHLEAGLPSVFTIRPNGQAFAQAPHPVHFFLLIM